MYGVPAETWPGSEITGAARSIHDVGIGTATNLLFEDRVEGHPLKMASTNHRDSPFDTAMPFASGADVVALSSNTPFAPRPR